ncbi:hypothetical protein DPMN_129211 [Dreissena polymorpha]|uniref:Solute carrier family 12 member 9 n=1 Tax=Dreissena polymorpha TaxID=45954 RepID=A0A9D4H492_DREPO|nr:hypothetical protein DPMN_129211 [Dreissena polymorpha]
MSDWNIQFDEPSVMASNGDVETSRLVDVESAEVYGSQGRLSDLSGSLPDVSESQETGDSVPLIHSPMVWRLPRGMSYTPKHTSSGDVRRTLGTFAGVFCPVALSQFSTMLFLRAGMLVGQSGILLTTVMMVLAYLILLLTVFSICAISTNGAVEGGGAYYMISRALGPEFGGSIGFLFYVANVLSCALYVTGFTEAILDNFSTGGSVTTGTGLPAECSGCYWKYLYASVVLLLCLLVCIVGGSLFGKTLVVIVLITIVCTLSVYISVFAKSKVINIGIPKDNHRFPNNTNLTFQYTGLSAHTFHENAWDTYTNYEGKKVKSFQEDYSTKQ